MKKSIKETLVHFILDKSGSMETVREATISGVNEYIGILKKDKKAKYSISITLFDHEIEHRPVQDISKVDELTRKTYAPNGMTALYDAVCSTVHKARQSAKKSGKHLVVIMTDGGENSSKEYTQEQLAALVEECGKEKNWTFVFLGANQDAWANAKNWGFKAQNVATYNSTALGVKQTFRTVAQNTSSFACSSAGETERFLSAKDIDDLANAK